MPIHNRLAGILLVAWLLMPLVRAEADLVSWWPLMEGGGTTARDVRGINHGTLTAMEAGDWITSPIRGGLVFGGTDELVDLGADSSLKPAALPISIAAWVSAPSTAVAKEVFSNDQGSTVPNTFHSGVTISLNSDNTVFTGYGDNTGTAAGDRRNKSSTTAVAADTWAHIVGIIRGATDMTIYVNAVDGGGTYSGTGAALAYSGRIGALARRGSTFSIVQIADVRLYSHALTPEEVLRIYTRGRMAR